MIKKITREVEVNCCDLCEKELTTTFRSTSLRDFDIGFWGHHLCGECLDGKVVPWINKQREEAADFLKNPCTCSGMVCCPGSELKCYESKSELESQKIKPTV